MACQSPNVNVIQLLEKAFSEGDSERVKDLYNHLKEGKISEGEFQEGAQELREDVLEELCISLENLSGCDFRQFLI